MVALKFDPPPFKRLFVGVSGGLDSIVLAHLAMRQGLAPTLVHVHHHLQPEADGWLQFVQDFAAKHEAPLQIFHVKTRPGHAESIEAFARQARYDFFRQVLEEKEDLLCLAHHQDDQVETFMINLVRGAGLNGLTAMPSVRPLGHGCLWRPLLAYSRQDLEAYADVHDLEWVEDPSNQDSRFDRNFLRNEILPLFKARWPHFQERVQNSIMHLQAVRHIMERHLELKLQLLHEAPGSLNLARLREQDRSEQILLLQEWVKQFAGLRLSSVHLERILQDFIETDNDAKPLFQFHGWALRRDRRCLFLSREGV